MHLKIKVNNINYSIIYVFKRALQYIQLYCTTHFKYPNYGMANICHIIECETKITAKVRLEKCKRLHWSFRFRHLFSLTGNTKTILPGFSGYK